MASEETSVSAMNRSKVEASPLQAANPPRCTSEQAGHGPKGGGHVSAPTLRQIFMASEPIDDVLQGCGRDHARQSARAYVLEYPLVCLGRIQVADALAHGLTRFRSRDIRSSRLSRKELSHHPTHRPLRQCGRCRAAGMTISGLALLSDQPNLAYFYPDAIGGAWRLRDDLARLRQLRRGDPAEIDP